jgi:CubicO group peptidase (beta-lactamase class C family)
MGKSLTAALIGRLLQLGKLQLDQPAPISEWQREGDPRSEIRIRDLLQMSSGLRFPAHRDPEVRVPIAQLEHMFIYTEAINVFDFAVNRPLEFIPGSTGRYRNCDPLSLGYILRNKVEEEGLDYLTWPQKELFDKIGIRRQVLETDPYGNFIMTGFDYGTARNWGRLGLLFLNNGNWNGEQILPEDFSTFVSTPAPGWEQPIYGGLFWLNGTGELSLPKDTYYMAGGGGQRTIICPSMDLIIVRMGHSEGSEFVKESLNDALDKILALLDSVK